MTIFRYQVMKLNPLKYIGMSLLVWSFWGCQVKMKYPTEIPAQEVMKMVDVSPWRSAGEADYEVYQDCPQGKLYQMELDANWHQVLVSIVSLGFYAPRTLRLTCART